MLVLLTAVAYHYFGAQLSREGVDWLLMNDDGSLCDQHGVSVAQKEAQPNIA